jgi:Type III restriction enzyme, res subunit
MAKFIYAYTHRGNNIPWRREGGQNGDFWIKVGQTKHAGLERVKQQLITPFPGLEGVTVLFHSEEATRPDGTNFTDHDVHAALRRAGIANVAGEWFEATPEEVRGAVVSLQTGNPFSSTRTQNFPLRMEQEEAIAKTLSYFKANSETEPKFLWNAKMRFGKTFTTYKLAQRMGWKRVLVLTYKPAVRSAWRDDLLNHVDFIDWKFIDAAVPPTEAAESLNGGAPIVWFASFQDVTGSDAAGNVKEKNQAIHATSWDCIVIDEFHFGASTATAKELYDPQDKDSVAYAKFLEKAAGSDDDSVEIEENPDYGLKTKFHLHLSGTPFKAIANGDYSEDQIFNWTYIDEQREKRNWPAEREKNPYAPLPSMEMYTYAMGDLARDLAEETSHFGFDLNTFFKARTVSGISTFERPDDVLGFLDLIQGKKHHLNRIIEGSKAPFPYGSEQFTSAVTNSIWFLQDIAACEAMSDILSKHPFFANFTIYVAAGSQAGVGASALPPLKKALDKGIQEGKAGSITLSCGKLMTGVTVAPWTSIFMLQSLKAPESYFQAAFRVQSPWVENGVIRKHKCFVFDFDPNRALGLLALYGTELANNSPNPGTTQATVLGELIDYLPIFAVDSGDMERLNTDAILEWAHGGVTSNSLARKWRSNDLYNLNATTMGALLHDEALLSELEQIEDFRDIKVLAEKIVSSTEKIKKAQRESQPKSALTKPKKEFVNKRRKIRDKLKKVSAKVLIFMYLTDFREERLRDVIESLDTELFVRSTGLSLEGFRKLNELGVFNEAHMNDAIQKFRYFEMKSIQATLEMAS